MFRLIHTHLPTRDRLTQEDTTSRRCPVPRPSPLPSLLYMVQGGIYYRHKMYCYGGGDRVDGSSSSSDKLKAGNCSLTTILEEPDISHWPRDRYISRCIIDTFSIYYDTAMGLFSHPSSSVEPNPLQCDCRVPKSQSLNTRNTSREARTDSCICRPRGLEITLGLSRHSVSPCPRIFP